MKNKSKILFLTAIFFGIIVSGTAYSGGSGTSSNPYQISTCEQFNQTATESSGTYFEQTSDLSCGVVETITNMNYNGNDYTLEFSDVTKNHLVNNPDSGAVKNWELIANDVNFVDGFIVTDTGSNAIKNIVVKDSIFSTNFEVFEGQENGINGLTIRDSDITLKKGSESNLVRYEGQKIEVSNNTINFDGAGSNEEASIVTGGFYNSIDEITIKNNDIVIDYSEVEYDFGFSPIVARGVNVNNAKITGNKVSYTGTFEPKDREYFYAVAIGLIRDTSVSYNKVLVGNNSWSSEFLSSSGFQGLNYVGPYSSASYTLSDYYYDTDEIQFSASEGTGLTTSELTGDSASSNLGGFDFTNTWATTGNYPALQFTLSSSSSLRQPESSTVHDLGDLTFEYYVVSRTDGEVFDLVLEYPNGTKTVLRSDTLNDGDTQTLTHTENLQTSGEYSYWVEISGEQQQVRRFEVVDYSNPDVTVNSPVDETVQSYSSNNKVDFNLDINNAKVSGSYTIQVKNSSQPNYSNMSSGTFSSGDNSITDTISVDFPASGTQTKEWRVSIEDEIGSSTSLTSSFTAERLEEPDISLNQPQDGDLYWVEEGGTVEIPFSGYVNNSEETGTAYARAEEDAINPTQYEIQLGTIQTGTSNYFSDTMTVGTTGQHDNARIDAELNSGNTFSSNSVSFEVKVANPVITSFNVTPSFESISTGDYFDVEVEGDIKNASIDRVEYDIDVGQTDAESFTKKPIDFQDQNSFTDSVSDAFQMKDEWRGEELTITATVYDVNGLTNSESVSGSTATPPDNYYLNSPADGSVFLIREGDTEIPVDIEWGIETAGYSGTAQLVINGVVEDSFSIGADSTNTQTFTQNYTEGSYDWKVRFEDSQGNTYESSTKTFDVTDEPVNLNLKQPDDGSKFNLAGLNTLDIKHSFDVDASAMSNDYYYSYVLTDGSDNTVDSRTSSNFAPGSNSHSVNSDVGATGNYSWTVDVFRASDDTLLESKTSTYEVVDEPVFNLDIKSPSKGDSYQLDEGENLRDIEAWFEVETFNENVDTTAYLDGTQVNTFSTASDTTQTYNFNLSDVSEGSHTFTVEGEDTAGRTNNASVDFEVIEYVEGEPDTETRIVEFRPNLEDARVGDELDLYAEGSGTPEDVQGVEVQVEVAGETYTYTATQDDLQEGSWYHFWTAALTVTQEMIGEDYTIAATLTDAAGKTSTYFTSGEVSGNTEIDIEAIYPEEGDTIPQDEGVAEDVRFVIEGSTLSNEARWEIYGKHQSQTDYTLMASSAESDRGFFDAETTSEKEVFINLNQTLGEYRDDFTWYAWIGSTEVEENTDESGFNTFSVVDDTQSILNFNDPDRQEYVLPEGENTAKVPFEGRADVNATGTLKIVNEDDSVGAPTDTFYEQDIGEGTKTFNFDRAVEQGTYTSTLTFESDTGYTLSKDVTYSVVEQETDTENSSISFNNEPQDRLYKDFQNTFGWTVYGAGESGTTTLYIENSNGEAVETVEYDYDTQNEAVPYKYKWPTGVSQGSYTVYAEAQLDTQNLTTKTYSFDVVDFKAPETNLLTPENGSTYDSEQKIPLSWATETYEDDIKGIVKVREEGEGSAETVHEFIQETNTLRERSREITRDAGDYEWFVLMDINPESEDDAGQFRSESGTFTVEPANIPEPNMTLLKPEQGKVFKTDENETEYNVTFEYATQVYSDNDANVSLLVETVENNEGQGYESFQSDLQTQIEDNVTRSLEKSLGEDGYRYKVRVRYPNGQEYESEVTSFAVQNPDTDYNPEPPRSEDTPSILDRATGVLLGVTGPGGQFFLAVVLTLIVSTGVTIKAESEKLGMATMVLVALGFSAGGWLPSWIGVVFVLISVGITVFVTNRLLNSGGR